MSDYSWNKTNILFTWFSSLYTPFKTSITTWIMDRLFPTLAFSVQLRCLEKHLPTQSSNQWKMLSLASSWQSLDLLHHCEVRCIGFFWNILSSLTFKKIIRRNSAVIKMLQHSIERSFFHTCFWISRYEDFGLFWIRVKSRYCIPVRFCLPSMMFSSVNY